MSPWSTPIPRWPAAAPRGLDGRSAPGTGCDCSACRPPTQLADPVVLGDAEVVEKHPLGHLEL